jgi:hypothetical protein
MMSGIATLTMVVVTMAATMPSIAVPVAYHFSAGP